MDLIEAIRARHSVRRYTDAKIEGEVLRELTHTIDECNRDGGLNIQLCLDEPNAFSGMVAKYGSFRNVKNYVAIVGKEAEDLSERAGYYGEKIVLCAQRLGLNTCWVAATYKKGQNAAVAAPGEKRVIVISIGYGENDGVAKKSKPIEALCTVDAPMPDWFRRGMEAARLAPTAVHQQKFHFELLGNRVKAAPGFGFYTRIDLGIAKCHFEIGAGREGWEWA